MFSRLKILLAVFQSSHYDVALFRAWLKHHPHPKDWDKFQGHAKVKWTAKARALFILSITFSRRIPWAITCNYRDLLPFERLAAKVLCLLASSRMRRIKFAAVIGITGSFGKTTTKEILSQILGQKFRVHRTPENINTLLGVAQWIRRTQFADGDIAIVEMGAYRRGDIAKIASMACPNIGILTGLNEAHCERFGSLEATAATKCELIDALPKGGIAFWNQDSELLKQAVEARSRKWEQKEISIVSYGMRGSEEFTTESEPDGEAATRIRINFGKNSDGMIDEKIPLLGRHLGSPISAALALARLLGLSQDEMVNGLKSLRPLSRRLEPIHASGNRLLIDDSYNITLDGMKAALDILSRIERRKIGVFAGIPEGGEESERINRELGKKIGAAFDIILLRETQVVKAVICGLRERGFPEGNTIRYNESKEVETILAKITKDNDCIYFSAYDWPAIYL